MYAHTILTKEKIMRILRFILAGFLTMGVLVFAQESNPEAQRRGWNVPRSEREHYGFAQETFRVKIAQNTNHQHPRMHYESKSPRMRNHGEFRGMRRGATIMAKNEFHRERAKQGVCPLCEKHKKMMSRNHVEKRGEKFQRNGSRHH